MSVYKRKYKSGDVAWSYVFEASTQHSNPAGKSSSPDSRRRKKLWTRKPPAESKPSAPQDMEARCCGAYSA
jgi:hypothetical protein